MANLKDKAVSGMLWSLLQNIGGRGITFIVTIILARLLTPDIFGLIGMLMIFIQVSQTLVVAGFNQALIQKKNTDEEDYSSVFWLNLGMSGILYIILFFSAPLIAKFYQQPILIELTRALSMVFVINAFSYVQETHLSKTMHFRTLTIINIPSTILGGIVGVGMAIMGFGIWSIVALQLVTRLAFVIQIWIYSKWSPMFAFNILKLRNLFSFGSKLMISEVINTIFRNVYLVVLGRFFPLASVGYYQHANNLVTYPTSSFTAALASVTFPVFSAIKDDNKKLKQGYKKILQQLIFWLCPAFVLVGVLAEPFFRFVFTEKWLPSVPYFRMLCVIGVLWPLNVFNLNIVNIKGRSDITLRLEVIKKLLITISLVLTIPYGLGMVIVFQVINSLFAFFLNSFYSGRFIQYYLTEQIKDILPILILSFGVGVIVYFINYALSDLSDLPRLLSGFGFGAFLYWVLVKFWQIDSYLEFQLLVKTRLRT